MTEWLLSGHNTQESSGVEHPLTATINLSGLGKMLEWALENVAGDKSDLDLTLPAAVIVQSRFYINMTYYMRNGTLVIPIDPEAMGVAKEMFTSYGAIPLRRRLLFPWRIYRLYRWTKAFYQTKLPILTQRERETYQVLRTSNAPSLEAIYNFFEPRFYEELAELDKGHIATTMFVTIVDSIIREKRPELLELFTGISTMTSMMGKRIWELRNIAQQCGPAVTEKLEVGIADLDIYRQIPEAAPFVVSVEEFLRQYGHRGFHYELDLDSERLDDRPEHILLAVAGQLIVPSAPPERAQMAHQQAQSRLASLPKAERPLWKWLLRWGQQLISWRENSKSMLSMKHAITYLAGQHLARHFFPNQPDDILLYYTLDEFLDLIRSKGQKIVANETVARRRAEYKLHFAQVSPPELLWYDPSTKRWRPAEAVNQEVATGKISTPHQFQGIPVSAGVGPVEGFALVTNDPVKAGRSLLNMQGNVILVTRFTDPAWSSLFGRLTGVVTELGGVISHAAIVARENGLPAVVGVSGILKWIHNGQRLRLDGKTGLVEILD